MEHILRICIQELDKFIQLHFFYNFIYTSFAHEFTARFGESCFIFVIFAKIVTNLVPAKLESFIENIFTNTYNILLFKVNFVLIAAFSRPYYDYDP